MATLLATAWLLSGCSGDNQRKEFSPDKQLVRDFNAKDDNPFLFNKKSDDTKTEAVRMVVYYVTIKQPDDGRTEQLWKLLRPIELPRATEEYFSQNGLQAASGGSAAWSQIAKLLKTGSIEPPDEQPFPTDPSVRVAPREIWLVQGVTVELPISTEAADQTLFWRDPGRPVVGRTYENCHRLLLATAEINQQGRVQVNLIPVLRAAQSRKTLLRQRFSLDHGEPERYVAKFEEFTLSLSAGAKGFLAIGKIPRASDAAFGGAFFSSKIETQSATTLLLILPQRVKHIPGKGFVPLQDY